jgi:hypothetical protein
MKYYPRPRPEPTSEEFLALLIPRGRRDNGRPFEEDEGRARRLVGYVGDVRGWRREPLPQDRFRVVVAIARDQALEHLKNQVYFSSDAFLAPTLSPPRPRRLARDLSALLGGQFLRPSFAAETRKLGSVPDK